MALVSSFMQKVDDLIGKIDDLSGTIDGLSTGAAEIEEDDLKLLWEDVKSLYSEVRLEEVGDEPGLLTAPEKEWADAKYKEVRQRYVASAGRLRDISHGMRLNSTVLPFGMHRIATASDRTEPEIPGVASRPAMRLPPCDTGDFDGSYVDWPSFRDLFTAIYRNHPGLSEVEKLCHLRMKCKGDALDVISGLPLTNSSFQLAWNALETQYNNPRVMVTLQLKRILQHPKASAGDMTSLRELQRTINNCVSTFRGLQLDSESFQNAIVTHLCATKLPPKELDLWEQSLEDQTVIPTWERMNGFLSQRCGALYTATQLVADKAPSSGGSRLFDSSTRRVHRTGVANGVCCLCSGQRHTLARCDRFLKMRMFERIGVVRRHRLCLNCLGRSHWASLCPSEPNCDRCSERHHHLLHIDGRAIEPGNESAPAIRLEEGTPGAQASSVHRNNSGHQAPPEEPCPGTDEHPSCSQVRTRHAALQNGVVLGTALVLVGGAGREVVARALIDSGSEATFITRRLQRRLALPTKSTSIQVTGVNSVVSAQISRTCEFTLGARFDAAVPIEVTGLVIPVLTGNNPRGQPKRQLDEHLRLQLADPDFYKGGEVDILVGGDFYPQILKQGIRQGVFGSLVAQETIFGWVLTGPLQTVQSRVATVRVVEEESLDRRLRSFWEMEQVPEREVLSKDDEEVERGYRETTTRSEDGRFTVALPFKNEFGTKLQLGTSRSVAVKQLERNERRMDANPDLKREYRKVLNEYWELGHMTRLERPGGESGSEYYLPHHAVVKPQSSTTKVRVVFDASRPTSTGLSLNDVLHAGPALQNDLVVVLTRWRVFRYVFNADVEKMYRQIRVRDSDCTYQRIVHRVSDDRPIEDFELRTVTFGVNAAPYLALRTLLELASEVESTQPRVSRLIRENFYVDDVLGGGHEVETVQKDLKNLSVVMESAGFPLRKWASNNDQVLEGVEDKDRLTIYPVAMAEGTKTLGIWWNVIQDQFYFRTSPLSTHERHTKRQVLSVIAKLFDPAGWLAPMIIVAKIIMQELWLQKTSWDDMIPIELESRFNQFLSGYEEASDLRIPRWLGVLPGAQVEVHGFCDASEKAYAAAVYLRIHEGNGSWVCNLLAAKSKVAPVKTLAIPRLELCGAVLLADLVTWLIPAIGVEQASLTLWTDSTIVLAWLKRPPCTWSTFVANRVARILRKAEEADWKHVASEDNPADLASRGVSADTLQNGSLWWEGPAWLRLDDHLWPPSVEDVLEEVPEIKRAQELTTCMTIQEDLLTRFSSFQRLLRVLAYLLRFAEHSRGGDRQDNLALSTEELDKAKRRSVRIVQSSHFGEDIRLLQRKERVPSTSKLTMLNPFLDDVGVLRVGGRLALSATMTYDERCPIILPAGSHLARLVLLDIHARSMHGGANVMLRLVRMQWWIPRAKAAVKSIIHQCKICVIARKAYLHQMMAPLPAIRTSCARPFASCGIDFAGPFEVKTYTGRACKVTKGYICLMVCLTTRALHLEVTSDLSTASFLGAFHRFVARRGCPRTVYSDNGTNFIGAAKTIRQEEARVLESVADKAQRELMDRNLEWKFIPPGAPHMGGLWEAGVKSVKTLFRKVIGAQRLTFEEMTTVLARVEAVLNSRPMVPMSEDAASLEALTPGHFLVGGPLLARTEEPPVGKPEAIVNRWLKVKAMAHEFAARWKEEYLATLHARTKWRTPQANIQVGDLVVVRGENLPSHEWRMGRVIQVHMGPDGLARIVTLKTARGELVRPVVKLVKLPVGEEEPLTTGQ